MGANGGNGSPVYPTLVRPPPVDPDRSPIENVLDVTELSVLGPDIFTNTRQPWHPPGARGIFGGAVIGLCLAAGQRTVPDSFVVHSCHCYFLLAGSGEVPILLHVERVRDGRSFATRTVQARQKGKCIFTTTISFCKEQESQGKQNPVVRHAAKLPLDAGPPPPDDWDGDKELFFEEGPYKELGFQEGPFQTSRTTVTNPNSEIVSERKTRQWVRTKGKISAGGGLPAHVNALAYVSDSYFLGTITKIHRLWRFPVPVEEVDKLDKTVARHLKALHDYEGGGDIASYVGRPQVGMMVSLDHIIHFHEPRRIKADEWMFLEKESPWSGDGRGVVTQRIFAKDGTLLATCYQEGLVRLKPHVVPEANDGDAKPKL